MESPPLSPSRYRFRFSLPSLPAEVLVLIFEYLSLRDQQALAATCRFFSGLLADPIFSELNRCRFEYDVRAHQRIPARVCAATDVIKLDKVHDAELLMNGVTVCQMLHARHVVCHVVRNHQVNWMMQWLPKCTKLQTLDVAGVPISDEELHQLALQFCATLQGLILAGCHELSKRALEGLAVLKNLQTIDLSGCNQFDDFSPLHSLPKLKVIRFVNPRRVRKRYAQ